MTKVNKIRVLRSNRSHRDTSRSCADTANGETCANFACLEGYSVASVPTCSFGSWSGGECTQNVCDPLPSNLGDGVIPGVSNGCSPGQVLTGGSSCTLKCDDGFGVDAGFYDCPSSGGIASSSLTCSLNTCNPIQSFGTGVMSSDSDVNGGISACTLNDELSAGISCAVQCDTNDGYGSGFGVFTCPSQGNTDAVSNLTCSRACFLDMNVQDTFGAFGGSCVPGIELGENQVCSFSECEEGKAWNGATDIAFNSFPARCVVNAQNEPFLEAQGWECKSIPSAVEDAGTTVVITTSVVGGSSTLSLMLGFQVALPLQLLVAIIIDSMQFFVALSVLGGRTSSIHRHLADTFGVVLMNETSALGPMFTALNDPIDEMNATFWNETSTNRTIRSVKFWSCKEDYRSVDFSSLNEYDRLTRDLVRRPLCSDSSSSRLTHGEQKTRTTQTGMCTNKCRVDCHHLFYNMQHNRSCMGMFSWNGAIRFKSFVKEGK